MTTPITFWDGITPLTAQQHANNILGLFELIQSAFENAGTVGVAGIGTTTFEGSPAFYLTLSDGSQTAPVKLPAAIMAWKGLRVAGTGYVARDVITAPNESGTLSTYLVLTDHVAAATLNADLVAGKIQLMASGGQDAENPKGLYNAAVPYQRRDLVFKDGIFWRATADAPVGSPAPGAVGSVWAITLYTTVPSASVTVTAEAKTLATVITELRAEIANLKTRVSDLEAA